MMQEAKEAEAGKVPEAVAAEGTPPEEKMEAEKKEQLSLWQRLKRRLLVWLLVGPTAEVTHAIFSMSFRQMFRTEA